jgi:hypothetical protein
VTRGEGNGKKGIFEIKDREVSGGSRNKRRNGVRVRDKGVYRFNSIINESKILDKVVGDIWLFYSQDGRIVWGMGGSEEPLWSKLVMIGCNPDRLEVGRGY